MAILGGYSILDIGKYGKLTNNSRITPATSDILNFKNRSKPIYVQNLMISVEENGEVITISQFAERTILDGVEFLVLFDGKVQIALDGNQFLVTHGLE